jgi:two-component system NtrC family sensor kinase
MFPDQRMGMPFYLIPPALGFLVFIVLALLSLFRGRRALIGVLFAGFCLSGALINLDLVLVSMIKNKALALRVDRFIYLFFVFSVPIYIGFVHVFLGIERKWVVCIAGLVSFFFMFMTRSDLFISGFHEYAFGTIAAAGPVYHAFFIFGGCAVLYCLLVLVAALRSATSSLRRNRIKYILLGMGMSSFLLFFNYLPMNGFPIYPMGNFGFIPAVILAFGVLKYDLFDIDAMIRKGTTYFFLTGSLTLLYVLMFYVFNIVYLGSITRDQFIFPFLLAVLMVFLYDPVRARIQDFVDRHFFKGKYDYRKTLRDISGRLTSLLKYEEISALLLSSITEALQVSKVGFIVRRGKEGAFYSCVLTSPEKCLMDQNHPLVALIGRDRRALSRTSSRIQELTETAQREVLRLFDHSDAVILFPVVSKETLRGMITLGEKVSGELLVHEDMELMGTIANQCAVALENAEIYEELERLNRDLERRVRERTAELARVLKEKEEAQDRLIRSESLAAVGQLVAGAAHEINNPISSASSLVQTSVETLKKTRDAVGGLDGVGEVLDDLEFTLIELKRVSDIVKSLLGLSRQTETYVESLNIHDVIEESLKILQNQCRSRAVAVQRDYQEDLPQVKGHFAHLGQCFVNIIKNAVEALPEKGGVLTLVTRKNDRRDGIVFQCRDNGKGIEAEHLKDIFKPFYTTKDAGKGTGLGLYISHEIVKKHGGRIDVVSEGNRGSTFTVELPLSPQRLEAE